MRIENIDIKNYEMTDYIYVGFPSKYNNPYSYHGGQYGNIYPRELSLSKYSTYLDNNPKIIEDLILELKTEKLHKIGTFVKAEGDILVKKINNFTQVH